MKDIAAQIHRGLYKKSDKANAPENQSDEWQAGYAAGLAHERGGASMIFEEWERRGKPDEISDGFAAWKRGMWAATMQKLMAKI